MKMIKISLVAATLLAAAPIAPANEKQTVERAAEILERFRSMPEDGIPSRVLRDARGVAILRVFKGGFIWSGRIGEGVVVARTRNGWSGPSFVRTGGAGFGAQVGGKMTEFVIVFNTDKAVKVLSQGGNVQIGGALSAVAGPIGRTAEAGLMPRAVFYTYSRSQGLFVGASLEGTVLMTDDDANARYYRQPVSASKILSGQVTPPRGAARLRNISVTTRF